MLAAVVSVSRGVAVFGLEGRPIIVQLTLLHA